MKTLTLSAIRIVLLSLGWRRATPQSSMMIAGLDGDGRRQVPDVRGSWPSDTTQRERWARVPRRPRREGYTAVVRPVKPLGASGFLAFPGLRVQRLVRVPHSDRLNSCSA